MYRCTVKETKNNTTQKIKYFLIIQCSIFEVHFLKKTIFLSTPNCVFTDLTYNSKSDGDGGREVDGRRAEVKELSEDRVQVHQHLQQVRQAAEPEK